MVKTYYVYALVDTRKGKKGRVFYIGKGTKGTDNNQRPLDHLRLALRGAIHNRKLGNKIKKITGKGLKYDVEFLFSSDDEKVALSKEKEWIDFYGLDNLCNLSPGGEGGGAVSDETKAKMSRSCTIALSNPEVRKKISDGVKKAIASGLIGKLVEVDGIKDTITATSLRIGMNRRLFSKWMRDGYAPQSIAEQHRKSPIINGFPLFKRPTADPSSIITPKQYAAIMSIHNYNGDLSVKVFATLLGISSHGGTEMLDSLSRKGFVDRVRHAEDKRWASVRLTPLGDSVISKMQTGQFANISHSGSGKGFKLV